MHTQVEGSINHFNILVNMLISDITNDVLGLKIQYCRDILDIVHTLKLGESKLKGLMLYELHCCFKEIARREKHVSIFTIYLVSTQAILY